MQSVDTLIHARWIIPVEPAGELLEHHALALHEGLIAELLPSRDAQEKYRAQETLTIEGHALVPGFVNAHTHAAMNLFKGMADDLPLMEWLGSHIWPAETRWVSDEFVRDGTRLAVAEMLRSGTTCFNDMYFFPDDAARVASAAGIRAVVGLIMIDAPTVWANHPDEYISKGTDVHDQFRNDPLISCAFAPHAPYTVSDESLVRLAALAEELDIPIHMHVHETAHEIERAIGESGERPLERLRRLGLLTPRLLAVHMTQVTDPEIEQVAQSGTHVVHCPESNLKLASGFCPAARLAAAGVNVALGTDGAASNNDLDMLGEMRACAYLAKGVAASPRAVPAQQALEMATLNGATALGLGETTGSLVAGKSADVIAIDLNEIETQPSFNPVSQIVYACARHQVTDVWIAGRRVLRNRALTTLDESALLVTAERWRQKLEPSRPREHRQRNHSGSDPA